MLAPRPINANTTARGERTRRIASQTDDSSSAFPCYIASVKELHTEIVIAASPERVWRELTDFAAYPQWNPLVPEASGEIVEGGRLRVKLSLSLDKRGVVMKPRLKTVSANRELRWYGRLPIPGLFGGEHVFELEPAGDGTRFQQWERFSGILVPLLRTMIDVKTKRGFEAMNVALKQRAEATASSR